MLISGFNLLISSRMLMSVVLGFALGLEREMTNKHAGLRTNILVCLGSAVFTLLSIYAFPTAIDSTHPQAFGDPARIAAQILTGIGFIGGGTVLRHGSSVYGLTTAATLWIAAAIGMACGAGMIGLGVIATMLSVAVLVFIRTFETNVLTTSTKKAKRLKISVSCDIKNAEIVQSYVMEKFHYIHEMSKEVNGNEINNEIKISANVDAKNKKQIEALYKKFHNVEGISSISIQEDNE